GRGQRPDRIGELFVPAIRQALAASKAADPPGGERPYRSDEPAERPSDHQSGAPDRESEEGDRQRAQPTSSPTANNSSPRSSPRWRRTSRSAGIIPLALNRPTPP